ncbi:MAG: LysR family transcriptional regulator [Verrucomicrobia bacterium]|nr:MAG: LysR family transcriptional regulator [Verrucomicrobiota bacterium]
MNIHHLELFYYVARHGGITEAVRNIPYGIQQPAVSGQVAQLEESLGVALFQRRPFALTAAGEKLFKFIHPFFSNLDSVANEIQGGREQRIRMGASNIVLRDHLPDLFQNIRKRFPRMKMSLCGGYQAELEALLLKGDLDLAVTLLEQKTTAGLRSLTLLELPLVLLVDKNHPVTDADQLWRRDRIGEPLICMPPTEAMCKNFQQGLAKRGIDWFPSIEVSAPDLIETYVANGFGIGVSVQVPKAGLCPAVRAISLPGFDPVHLGALWRGKPSTLVQAFLDEMQLRARKMLQSGAEKR